MDKTAALRRLDTVIDKLSKLSVLIEGNQLQYALHQVEDVRDKVLAGQLLVRKRYRKKPVRSKIKSRATTPG